MKKIFALLLSVAMVASLFVGVAFAAPDSTYFLQANVVGTVGLNQVVFVNGTLSRVGNQSLVDTLYGGPEAFEIWLQRRSLTATSWTGAVTAQVITPNQTTGQFSMAVQLATAGVYRLVAVKNGAIIVQNDAALAVSVGTVSANTLTVTPSTTNVTWGVPERALVSITVARTNAQGIVEYLNNPANLTVTFSYDGLTADQTTGYTPVVNGNTITYSIDKPVGSAATGPITVNVGAESGNWFGTATVNVNAREAFNVIVTPGTAVAGQPVTINVQQFDAAGRRAGATGSPYAYTVTTYSGSFAAIDPVVRTDADHNPVTVTPKTAGVITVKVVGYDSGHNKTAEVVREIKVTGVSVELGIASARRGETVKLTAIVTDANGNRINNALVTFTGTPRTGGDAMFITRDQVSGAFPTPGVPTNTVEVNGMALNFAPGYAVNNGEYSVEVKLNEIGTIAVTVATPTLVNNQLQWTNQASMPAAIEVLGAVAYKLSVTNGTLVAAAAAEVVEVTVRDNDNNPVTSGLSFESSSTRMVLGGATHIGNGVYRISTSATRAGTYKINVKNATARNVGSVDITVLAPVVEVTPNDGLITANFNDEITVKVTDPRTGAALSLPIKLEVVNATAPNGVALATAAFHTRQQKTTTATAWSAYDVDNGITASTHMFQINAYATSAASRTIAGVAQTPKVRVNVGSGATIVELTLANATLDVTPEQLHLDRTATITVKLVDAHGKAMTGRLVDFAGMGVNITGAEIPAAGELNLVVKPTASGIISGNVEISVTPDRADATKLTKKLPVTAAPTDAVAPTIEVTAPAISNDATATITVTVKDDVAIQGIIFDGANITMFPTKAHMFVRTVDLKVGLNTFTVMAMDTAGNVTSKVIEIERKAPPAPPAPVKHVITIGKANPAIGLDVPANVRNGRLMVPFRWFGEQVIGATVDYKVVGSAEIVTLHKGNTHIELTLNSTIAKVNGNPVSLDVAAYATGGRTLVPARFVAETFGYVVDWNAATDDVTFTKK